MIFAEDDDGALVPVTRDDLVRVWRWQKGQLASQIVRIVDQGAVIEALQREGWHAWATLPIMTVGG